MYLAGSHQIGSIAEEKGPVNASVVRNNFGYLTGILCLNKSMEQRNVAADTIFIDFAEDNFRN